MLEARSSKSNTFFDEASNGNLWVEGLEGVIVHLN